MFKLYFFHGQLFDWSQEMQAPSPALNCPFNLTSQWIHSLLNKERRMIDRLPMVTHLHFTAALHVWARQISGREGGERVGGKKCRGVKEKSNKSLIRQDIGETLSDSSSLVVFTGQLRFTVCCLEVSRLHFTVCQVQCSSDESLQSVSHRHAAAVPWIPECSFNILKCFQSHLTSSTFTSEGY